MFTGIIEEIGTITDIQRGGTWCSLTVKAKTMLEDIHEGDSIAVNGVCLTVTTYQGNQFSVDVMPETMNKTNLDHLQRGSSVNLERAMAAGGRFGGHFVSGHVDGTASIIRRTVYGNAVLFEFKAPEPLLNFMIPKGSITIDGISLTILDVATDRFQVSIIPHTLAKTTLNEKAVGSTVNLECDMIGKYIEKFVAGQKSAKGISTAFLSEHGFL